LSPSQINKIYTYVTGNPLSKIDPYGKAVLGETLGGWIGGGVAGIAEAEAGPFDIVIAMAGRATGAAVGSKIETCAPKIPARNYFGKLTILLGN
jgi:hypothetical protein